MIHHMPPQAELNDIVPFLQYGIAGVSLGILWFVVKVLRETNTESAERHEKAHRECAEQQASNIAVIDKVIAGMGDMTMQQMGQVIGAVKAKVGNTADGALVAKLVKEKLQ